MTPTPTVTAADAQVEPEKVPVPPANVPAVAQPAPAAATPDGAMLRTFGWMLQFIRSKREAIWIRLHRQRLCKTCVHWRVEPGGVSQGTCWWTPPQVLLALQLVWDKDPAANQDARIIGAQTNPMRTPMATTAMEGCGQWRRYRRLFSMFGDRI